ncbi:ornithine carbamoyltransferase [Prochlorococcus marinus]|uniref:Ornithine carbamoyltransferase n=1 Tax=Prochlorococcus marinus (strain MIT 9211) TaxID=93059 RepID=A9BBM5_PROM4|nr:ornithine carbamoyltransferase [Prochlorococcus marinus]ABX09237.1 Ornithine carbamoyltransferase [Prochlorococcus marinus str. MIT 9211]
MDASSQGVARELSLLKGKDLISSADFQMEQINALFNLSIQLKKEERRIDLGNRVLGLIFSKASTRTRVSFQVAMARLGGQVVDLSLQATQIGRGEPVKDTARVLSRYCDALAIRTYSHEELIEYANWASIPVINALTDLEHPCQALADFLTIKETFGKLKGLTLAYIGDGNNVSNSLILLGAILGVHLRVACPSGFEPSAWVVEKARSLASFDSTLQILNEPVEAVRGANAIYTDVWASMGQEKEQQERKEIFKKFTVDENLFCEASQEAIVLHCLPAHRGEEITDELIESKASKIFHQAENRLHIQQALLASLLGGL